MPKKSMPRESAGLPAVPPPGLNSAEKKIYLRLRDQLVQAGFDQASVLESLLVTVQKKARLDKVQRLVGKLKNLTVTGSTGNEILHPLVRELRSLESSYESSLGRLLLTSRSQSVARVEQTPQNISPEDDCVLRLLGG